MNNLNFDEEIIKSVELFQKGEFNNCKQSFLKLIKKDSKNLEYLYILSECELYLHNYENALKYLIKIYKLNNGFEYNNVIQHICFLLSRNIVNKDIDSIINLFSKNNFKIVALILELIEKKINENSELYLIKYIEIIKNIFDKVDMPILNKYSTLLSNYQIIKNILNYSADKMSDCEDINIYYNQYFNNLSYCKENNEINNENHYPLEEILYKYNFINHTIFSYNNLNNLSLYQSISKYYQNLFPSLNNIELYDKSIIKTSKITLGFILSPNTYNNINGIILNLPSNKFEICIFLLDNIPILTLNKLYTKTRNILSIKNYNIIQICNTLPSYNIDILIYSDIGYNMKTYLLSHIKFAPIQCSTWIFPDTSGNPAIDYYFTSKLFENEQELFSEKLLHIDNIPSFYSEIDYKEKLSPINNKINYLTLATLLTTNIKYINSLYKIIKEDESFHLIVLVDSNEIVNKKITNLYKNIFNDQYNKIKFIEYSNNYLDTYKKLIENNNVDIILDTFYFNKSDEILIAINANKPIITCEYNLRTKFTKGLYKSMDINYPVSRNIEEFVEKSIEYGKDKNKLEELTREIKENKKIIYNNSSCIEEWTNLLFKIKSENIKIIDKQQHFLNALKDMDSVMKEANIPYFLARGTMLGCHRNGKFIEYDKDMDIGVFYEDFKISIEELAVIAEKYGFKFIYMNGTLEKGLQLSYINNRATIDIFLFYKENKGRYSAAYYGYKRFIKFIYDEFNTQKIKFFDTEFYAPDNIEKYLLTEYGENWNKPDPDYCWYTQPNNTYPFIFSIINFDGITDNFIKLVKYMKKRCDKKIIFGDASLPPGPPDSLYKNKRINNSNEIFKKNKMEIIKYFNEINLTSDQYEIHQVSEKDITNFISVLIFNNNKELYCYVNEINGKINGNDYEIIKYECAIVNVDDPFFIKNNEANIIELN